MGRMSLETRAKVIRLKNRGMPVQQIAKHLDSEGVNVLKVSLYALFKKYIHCIQDQKRRSRSRPQLLNDNQYRFIDNTIANNVNITSRQLHAALISEYPELEAISISTVKLLSPLQQLMTCHIKPIPMTVIYHLYHSLLATAMMQFTPVSSQDCH